MAVSQFDHRPMTPKELEELRKKQQRMDTVPLKFLPPDENAPQPSKFAERVMATLFAVLIAGGIVVGLRSSAPDWHPLLEPYAEFVEEERGLQFIQPVVLSDQDFWTWQNYNPHLQVEPRQNRFFRPPNEFDSERWTTVRWLLGLETFDPGRAQWAATLPIPEDQVILGGGYFNGRIYIPQDLSETQLQLIIVRQLTHALQDQHQLLSEAVQLDPEDDGRLREVDEIDEASDGLRMHHALATGDADRIARRWWEQMTVEEQAEYRDAVDGTLGEVGDPWFDGVEHSVGAPLVEWIVERDGVDALNTLLAERDALTTDVFVDVLGEHGRATVDARAEIDLPASRQVADGSLGAFGWFISLAPVVGVEDAFDAVSGYDNDAFAAFVNEEVRRTSPNRQCARFDVFFDGATEAQEFFDIISEVGATGEVRADRSSATIDICERLAEQGDQTPAPILPLAVAAELAVHHLRSGETEDVARCAAFAQAKTVTLAESLDGFVGYEPYIDASGPFLDVCR